MTGMHFGILVADLPWSKFFPLLSAKTGRFLDQGPVDDIGDIDDVGLDLTDEGYPIVAGEHQGKSYILDTSFLMSMDGADFIVELSQETGVLIIGCGAETMSGSYSFLAVRAGAVLRRFWDCQAVLAEPLDEGEPLPTEESLWFEEQDGKGLIAALAHFGFDFDGWYHGGQRRQYLYTADEAKSSGRGVHKRGPLAEKLDEHCAELMLAEHERPTIMMFTRDAVTGQIVSSQDTGLRLGDAEVSNPDFWDRFWKKLTN
jgi:hypothetical protein